jgi:hypothetical protein
LIIISVFFGSAHVKYVRLLKICNGSLRRCSLSLAASSATSMQSSADVKSSLICSPAVLCATQIPLGLVCECGRYGCTGMIHNHQTHNKAITQVAPMYNLRDSKSVGIFICINHHHDLERLSAPACSIQSTSVYRLR